MMTSKRWHSWLAPLLIGATLSASLPAALVQTGNVTPNVSTWSSNTTAYVGQTSAGSVAINGGSFVTSFTGYLGYHSGSTGTATVTGAGSTWINSTALYVGYDGNGTLTTEAGGHVVVQTLFASLSDLHGDGTIAAKGAVLDADLVFDATHGTSQSLAFGSGGTLNLTTVGGGDLGAGYKGLGSLIFSQGVNVSSRSGYLGYNSGSTGTATVTGAGSKWTNSNDLYVSNGTLAIEAGGQVNSFDGNVGYYSGSTGTATVTGTGSTWTNSSVLDVGGSGKGTLTIEAGGQVSDSSGYLASSSGSTGMATATVTGPGSKWTNSSNLGVGNLGTGTLTIEAGGQVSNNSGFLGSSSGSTGTATVTGASSKWTNSSNLSVGISGSFC